MDPDEIGWSSSAAFAIWISKIFFEESSSTLQNRVSESVLKLELIEPEAQSPITRMTPEWFPVETPARTAWHTSLRKISGFPRPAFPTNHGRLFEFFPDWTDVLSTDCVMGPGNLETAQMENAALGGIVLATHDWGPL